MKYKHLYRLLTLLLVTYLVSTVASAGPVTRTSGGTSVGIGSAALQSVSTRSEKEILSHSNGWIRAHGYSISVKSNPANGAVGYVVPNRRVSPAALPSFGRDGAMNPDTTNTYQAETTIAINPANSLVAVGAANDTVTGSVCNNSYRTSNGGISWVSLCPPPIPGYLTGYDPAIAYAPDGSFAYLAGGVADDFNSYNEFWRSSSNGASWTRFDAPNTGVDNDREYIWVDRTIGPRRGTIYMTWTAIDSAYNFQIAVSSSTDQGKSWSAVGNAGTSNLNSGRLYQYASLAPLPSGNAVAMWIDDGSFNGGSGDQKIRWARSYNGGLNFPDAGIIATIPNDRAIPFNSTLPNKTFRISAAPNVAADPITGKLYAVWSAYRTAGRLNAGIYLATSVDDGKIWSVPQLVSPTTLQDQFLPWVTVSSNHMVHITWGDSRNDSANVAYDWYYADSLDGGATFEGPVRLSSVSSAGDYNPGFQPVAGDYAASYASDDSIYTTWSDNRQRATRNVDAYFRRGTFCVNPFNDILGNPYYAAIHNLYCRGVVSGYSDGFHPAAATSRGQLAKVVALSFALEPSQDVQHFSDVPPTNPFFPFVEAVYQKGLMSGYTGQPCNDAGYTSPCFLPANLITRAQLVKTTVLVGGYTLINPPTPTYSDVPPDNWAYQYVETAHAKGLIAWIAPPTFGPGATVRRDELCQTVYLTIATGR